MGGAGEPKKLTGTQMNDLLYSFGIYFLTFFFSTVLMKLSELSPKMRSFFALIAIGVPVVTAAFRECGIDYTSYEGIYYDIQKDGTGYTEWAWTTLNRIAPSYRWLLFLAAFIFFFVFYIAITRYTQTDSALAWFIVLTVFMPPFYNVMRQMLAVAFVLLAVSLLRQEKYVGSFLAAMLGGGFHKTAYIIFGFLLCYHLLIRKNGRWALWLVLATAAVIVAAPLAKLATDKLGIFGSYDLKKDVSWSFEFLLYLLPPVIVMLRKDLVINSLQGRYCLAIYMLSIPFQLLGNRIEYADRFSLYTQAFIAVLVPQIVQQCDEKKPQNSLRAYYYAWFSFQYVVLAVLMNSNGSYPYRNF